MVTIGRFPIKDTGTMHDLVATPSTCTVQAPQALTPQPYLVPVIFSSSRNTQRSGVEGSTFTSLGFPLTVSSYVAILILLSTLWTWRSCFHPSASGGNELLMRHRRQ